MAISYRQLLGGSTATSKPQGGSKACPYCDSDSTVLYSAPDYNRRVSNDLFHMNQCDDCDLLFLSNPPSNLGPFYETGYHTSFPKDLKAMDARLKGERYKIDFVRQFNKSENGSLLEIGPSVGYFSRLAQKEGYNVSALEYDQDCVDFLNETLKINAIQTDNPATSLEKDTSFYDVICLWHAIEHLPEPWKVIEQASKRLKPGGHLIIATPNPRSSQLGLMKNRWPHLDMPRHLFLLPIKWIKKMVKPLGIKEIFTTTRDTGSLYWESFSWAMLWGARPVAQHSIRRRFWQFSILMGHVLQNAQRKEGRGACYTMVLQKQ